MSKTLICRELGGTCDKKFAGDTLMEIVQKAMPHMMSDEPHKAAIMNIEAATGENKEQWMARMQREFDARPSDT